MSSDVLRVHTFDDRFYDVDRRNVNSVGDLKDRLTVHLGCPACSIQVMFSGRTLPDYANVALLDRVYASVTTPPKNYRVDCKQSND